MGRLDSLLDDKLREKNRNLVLGYIQKRDNEERARQRAQSAKMNTAPIDSGVNNSTVDVPSSHSSMNTGRMNSAGDESLAEKYKSNMQFGGIHDAPVSLPFKLPKMNPVENNGNGYNWSEKQGTIGNAEQSVQKPHVELTEKDYEKLWQDYSKSHPKRIPDNYNGRADFAPNINPMGEEEYKSLLKGDYEKSGEYQFLNELSKNPIGGRIAPVFGTAWNAMQSSIAGAEGVVNTAHQLVSKEKLKPESMTQQFKSNAVRAGTLRSLRNNLGFNYDDGVESTGEKVTDFLGGVALDSTASAARALTTGMGSLLLSSGTAANQEYLDDSVNPNITRNQMLASGMAKGIAESAWEYLPTSRFLELSKNGLGTTGKEIAKNIFKQSMQEGLEEFGTDLTNDVTDYLIKGKESDVAKDYLARRANGESDLTAKMHTATDRIGSAGMSFLGGALSGGMSAGMAGVNHTLNNGFNYNDLDGHYKEIAESADTSTEEGKVIYDVANRLAEKEARGEKVTLADKGYLANAVENAEIVDYNKLQETPIDLDAVEKDVNEAKEETPESRENVRQDGSVPYALFSDTETGKQAKTDALINNAYNNYANNSEQNSAERYLNDKASLKEFAKNYDTEGKKAFVENYDGNIPLTDYIKASTHAYNLGRYSYTLNGEDSLDKTASMALLTKEQRENLFKAGIKDNNDAMKKWKVNYKERITKREGGLMDSVPHAPMNLKNLLEKLGRKTGILFRITDSKYQDGDYANGSYEKGKGIITVDLQSDNILGTISHEMTHWIKEYTSEGDDLGVYGWFKGLALNSILKSKNTDLDSLIETYKQSYGNLSNEEITDEIVADSTMHFLNDEEFINKLVNGTEEQKSLGMKVVQWLNDIIESFKDLISHNGERLASRALREDLTRYEETRDAWLVAMSKAKENMARNEAVTENSDSGELSQVQLQKVIEDGKKQNREILFKNIYENPDSYNDKYVYAGETPSVLSKILGIRELPMVIEKEHIISMQSKDDQEVIEKINPKRKDIERYNAHTLTAKDILNSIEGLNSPQYIIKYKAKQNDFKLTVVTDYSIGNSPVIVGIIPSIQSGYLNVQFISNRISSIYDKSSINEYINKAVRENRLLYVSDYIEKNRELAKVGSTHQQLPDISVIDSNLARYKDGVKGILAKDSKKLLENSESIIKYENGESTNLLNQLDISEEYYNSLVEENENLKEENSYLSDVLNAETRFEPSRSDVNRIASDLLSQYNSQFSKAKLADQLSGFYKYLNEARDIDGGEVRSVSRAIAREVIENATYKEDSEVQDYNKVKEFFSGRPIYITERELHDLGYEKFGDLRKQYFGKVDFRKATVDNRGNADDVYKSFSEAFPHLVTGDKSYTDELNNLIEAYEMAIPKVYEAFPGEEHDQAVDRLSDEIYDAFLSVGDERLYQKYKDGYKKIKEKARAEVQAEFQKKYNKALDKIKQLRKDYENSLISHEEFIDAESRLLSRGGAEYQARLEMHRAYRQKQEEQRHRQIYKKEIVRDSKALMKMAVNPTDNLHVPKVLLKDLVPVLSAVDFSSYDAFYEKKPKIEMTANEFKTALATLTSRIQEAENNGDVFTEENGKGVYFPIDPSLVEGLSEIKDAVNGIGGNMNRLSTEDLQTLRDSLRGFKHIVESQNKYISMKNGERVSDVAQEVIQEFKEQDARKELWGIAGNVKDFLTYGMMDAYTFFHEMGDGGHKVYKVLRNARDKKTQALSHIEDSFKDAMKESNIKAKNLKKLSTDTVKFSALATNNMQTAEVEMTKAQLMSLYLHNLREQSRMHLYGLMKNDATGEMYEGNERLGGFKVRERRGRGLKKLTVIKDVNTYKMTEAELNKIVKENLSENEIKFAQRIGQILSNEVAKYGNEASNAVYGYDKFTEKNYFPIKVDSDSLTMKNTDLEKMMSTLKNKGMTKALQKEAYNPIMIDDIFEVAMSHIDEMTSYASYFPAIIDMQKFYNFADENGDSVHRELSRAMGKGGTEYYMNLLRDLNGSRGGSNFIDKLAQGFSGPYKGSMVLANARVAIQQPTAYLRALNVIEPKYLAQGLTLPKSEANTEWENAKKYAPIAQWKAMSGSYDINVGKSLRRQFTGETTFKNAITDITAIPLEAADEFAWKRLWYASEKKVEDTTSLKKGTEEYYKAAAEIFNEIIDATQVVDSVLNRTDAMKSTSGLVKLSTSFMSEPSKTYNMVYRTYSDFKKGKATKKQMVSVLAVATLGAAVTSGVASLISAMRNRDKDKKYGERWLDAFIRDFTDNLKPWNYVPILKDFIEALDTKQYGSNNFATKPITEAVRAIKALSEFRNEDSKLGWLGNIYQASNSLNILGIPMHNALRDIGAFYDTAIYDSPLANVGLQYERDKMIFNMEGKNSKGNYVNVNRFLASALKAYTLGDQKTGDKIVNELKARLGDDLITEKLQEALSKDDMIIEIAEKNLAGEDTTAEREALLHSGYSEAMIDKALGNAYKKLKPIEGDDLAEKLFEQSEDYKDSLDAYVEYQRAIGADEKKIRSSVKSAVTSKYKKLYQDAIGNPAVSDEILKKILRITYDGKQLYTESDLKKWAK